MDFSDSSDAALGTALDPDVPGNLASSGPPESAMPRSGGSDTRLAFDPIDVEPADADLARRIELTPAGPELVGLLASIEVATAATEVVWQVSLAAERQGRWDQARQMAAHVELERRARAEGLDERTVPAEMSMRLSLTPMTAGNRLGGAVNLAKRHPHLWRAVQEEGLDPRRAEIVADEVDLAGKHAPADSLNSLEDEMAAKANELTTEQIKSRVRRRIDRLFPVKVAHERHEKALVDRGVWFTPMPDGMAEFAAVLPAAQASAAKIVVDRMATERRPNEDRSLDQRRADALGEMFMAMLNAEETPLGMLPTKQRQRPNLMVIADPRRPAGCPCPTRRGGGPAGNGDGARGGPDGGGPGQIRPGEGRGDGGCQVDGRSVGDAVIAGDRPEPPALELDGYGPITPAAAARFLGGASISYLVLDPVTGERHHAEPAPSLTVTGVLAGIVSGVPAGTDSGAPATTVSGIPATTVSGAPATTVSGALATTVSGIPAASDDQPEDDPLVTASNGQGPAPPGDPPPAGSIAARAERLAYEWQSRVVPSDSYRPLVELIRHVLLRDGTCTFPTCRVPAWRCEIDHIVPFDPAVPPVLQTRPENLQAVCKGHHQLKSLGRWQVTRDQATGIVTWTSPAGYSRSSRVEYLDDGDDPPGIRPRG